MGTVAASHASRSKAVKPNPSMAAASGERREGLRETGETDLVVSTPTGQKPGTDPPLFAKIRSVTDVLKNVLRSTNITCYLRTRFLIVACDSLWDPHGGSNQLSGSCESTVSPQEKACRVCWGWGPRPVKVDGDSERRKESYVVWRVSRIIPCVHGEQHITRESEKGKRKRKARVGSKRLNWNGHFIFLKNYYH